MNTNPSLVLGLAQRHVERLGDVTPGDRMDMQVRVYPGNGSGYYHIRAQAPGRWYWIEETGADHFARANMDELHGAIESGAKVQVTGYHQRPLATWDGWADFKRDINGVPS